ncbi:hypothetical protein THOM_2342, partial [Trachipleistophora hominis]
VLPDDTPFATHSDSPSDINFICTTTESHTSPEENIIMNENAKCNASELIAIIVVCYFIFLIFASLNLWIVHKIIKVCSTTGSPVRSKGKSNYSQSNSKYAKLNRSRSIS